MLCCMIDALNAIDCICLCNLRSEAAGEEKKGKWEIRGIWDSDLKYLYKNYNPIFFCTNKIWQTNLKSTLSSLLIHWKNGNSIFSEFIPVGRFVYKAPSLPFGNFNPKKCRKQTIMQSLWSSFSEIVVFVSCRRREHKIQN